jgi:CAAX protease family protein
VRIVAWVLLLSAVALGVVRVVSFRRRGIGVTRALGLTIDATMPRHLAIGIGIGATAMVATFVVAYLAGSIPSVTLGRPSALVTSLGLNVTGAFVEELVFRVGLLGGLLVLFKGRPAVPVIVVALIFGGIHGFNPHATAWTVIGTIVSGAAYCIGFAATERIWLPFGTHFAWNYFQGPVFGFPVSGRTFSGGSLLEHATVGETWFTGGAYGPEGGLVGQVGRLVMIGSVIAWAMYARRNQRATIAGAPPSTVTAL